MQLGINPAIASSIMSYCLNPTCPKPTHNPSATRFCAECGSKLLLRERYRAIQLIGQGGFSRTFLGIDEDKPSKPQCAIKQFFYQGSGAQKAAELFEREAVRLEELGKYPQIPDLFAHFQQDSRLYIVQEFIDGQNLAEELAATGAFSESKIRSLLQDLLPILKFIHDGQVIHRDIKPENIIRRRDDGKLVLVDFGAAKYASTTALGKTGTTIGSAGYAAPEQNYGKAVFASDLYSLGVTCIHLLTQQEPFDLYDASESAFMWRHLALAPFSDALADILDKMTQTIVKQRYQSAEEILHALSDAPVSLPSLPVAKPLPALVTLKGDSDPFYCIAISPDGKTLVSGSRDKTIKLWNLKAGREIRTVGSWLSRHSGAVLAIAISPDGKTIASACDHTTIKLWDIHTLLEKHGVKAHLNSIYSLAFSPDGKAIASCSYDGTIKLWDARTLALKRSIKAHSLPVFSIAFSPDGQQLVSGSKDATVKLWDVGTGQEIRCFRGHTGGVNSIAISPLGKLIASGGSDNTILVWDADSSKNRLRIEGHSYSVKCVAFSPDGEILASASGDATIKLWNLRTLHEIGTLNGHSDEVFSVVFSPDGQTLVSASWDYTIKIWRVSR